MATLTIELGDEIEPALCQCCGNETRRVYGFVFQDSNAYAVYFAAWTVGHVETGVAIAICLGDWGEDSSPTGRYCVSLMCRATDDQFQFTVIDPTQSPWADITLVGKRLRREEALAHPEAGEFFHIAEHVISDDPRVSSFLKTA